MQEVVNLILVDGQASKISSRDRRLVIEIADVASPSAELLAASGPALLQMKNAPSPRVLTTHIHYPLLPKGIREQGCKVLLINISSLRTDQQCKSDI